ncbi:MAG: methyltransferase domain-containing protein, partial [Trebonia sp.]
MTTAIIGTGVIGSVIARRLAAGGEPLRLSSADKESARKLAAGVGHAAVATAGNRDAVRGADAVVLALRFTVLKSVIDEIAGPLAGKVVIVPSNPLSADAHGNVSRVLPEGQSSGAVVAGWLPESRLAMAFGTLSAELFASAGNRSPEPAVLFYVTDDDRAGEETGRLIRRYGLMTERAHPEWNDSYTAGPPAPWDIGRPQPAFARLADEGRLTGRLLDAGCGTGENSLLAASHGADVTGIDVAPTAIARARAKAAERRLTARFEVADALDLGGVALTADTGIDSGVFHVFGDADRAQYVASLA